MRHFKLFLTFLLLTALGIGNVWGDNPTIEINTTNSGVTGSYADKTFTVDKVQFGYTQWCKSTNIQAKKSTTNSCYNVDAIPGTIVKITVVQTGTARAISMKGGTSSKPTSAITQPTTGATMVFDFSGKNYTYFTMTTPGNACYINTITIEYATSGGGSTQPTVSPTPTIPPFHQVMFCLIMSMFTRASRSSHSILFHCHHPPDQRQVAICAWAFMTTIPTALSH